MEDILRVLIIGAGPIGLLFVTLFKLFGIEEVYISAKGEERIQRAFELGARVVTPKELHSDFLNTISPDLVVEATGRGNVWEETLDLVSPGGKVLLFGGLEPGTKVNMDATKVHYGEVSLFGSFHYTRKDVRDAFKLIEKKQLPLEKLISGELKLEDIETAFKLLMEGKGIKFVIRP